MLLGLVVHSGSFVAGFQTPQETWQDNSVLVLAILVHNFRMPAFFAIAGLFAAMLIDQRGIRGFWSQRSRRLLWPLLVAEVTVIPITLAVSFAQLDTPQKFIEAGWMHMWFVYYLLLFSGITILIYWSSHKTKFGIKKHELAKTIGRKYLSNPAAIAILALITFLLPAYFDNDSGALERDSSFIPNFYLLVFYGVFFSLGFLSYYIWQTIERKLRDQWWLFLLIGGTAFAIYAVMLFGEFGHDYLKLAYTISTWMLAAGFIAIFLKFADKPNKFFIYFSDASYWIYIVHLPIVIATLFWLTKWQVPLAWSFIIAIVVAFAVSTVSYQWFVKDSIIGKFLAGKLGQNGKKKLGSNKKVRR
ncbi:MAG: hypothetical protein RL149_928 [Actinomycetota bacterium]